MQTVIERSPELMTIGELSRLSGVNPVTIRAWERRYGLLQPERNAKGYRFYRTHHVEEVNEILKWLARGYAISKVKPILLRDQSQWRYEVGDVWLACQEQCYRAVRELNERRFDQVLSEMLVTYPLDLCADHVLLPCLDQWVVDYQVGLISEPVFQFGFNALRTRFHHRLSQINRSRKSAAEKQILLVTLSDARYDGHFYVFANLLAERHQAVKTLHASSSLDALAEVLSAFENANVLLFAQTALNNAELSALQKFIANLTKPVSVFGAALNVQREALMKLPVTLVPGRGSSVITNWMNSRGGQS